jgi:hypothetical protein
MVMAGSLGTKMGRKEGILLRSRNQAFRAKLGAGYFLPKILFVETLFDIRGDLYLSPHSIFQHTQVSLQLDRQNCHGQPNQRNHTTENNL